MSKDADKSIVQSPTRVSGTGKAPPTRKVSVPKGVRHMDHKSSSKVKP